MLENVKALLKQRAPLILDALQESTSDDCIEQLEQCVNLSLPEDLLQLYKEANGINPNKHANFVYGIPFIPIEESIRQINEYKNSTNQPQLTFADKGIKQDYTFGHMRIPIGDDSGTSLLCVDLDPTAEGTYGQIILIDHENSVALKLNNSIKDCIDQFEHDLQNNKYSLQEDALEDGVHWLSPVDEIDPINWFNSDRWAYVKT